MPPAEQRLSDRSDKRATTAHIKMAGARAGGLAITSVKLARNVRLIRLRILRRAVVHQNEIAPIAWDVYPYLLRSYVRPPAAHRLLLTVASYLRTSIAASRASAPTAAFIDRARQREYTVL
jgi:hypothetical protein